MEGVTTNYNHSEAGGEDYEKLPRNPTGTWIVRGAKSRQRNEGLLSICKRLAGWRTVVREERGAVL